jgi:hypothetical protein
VQHRFNQAISLVLKQLSDRTGCDLQVRLRNLDKSLADMVACNEEEFSSKTASAKARGMIELSRQIRDEVVELVREVSGAPVSPCV